MLPSRVVTVGAPGSAPDAGQQAAVRPLHQRDVDVEAADRRLVDRNVDRVRAFDRCKRVQRDDAIPLDRDQRARGQGVTSVRRARSPTR